MDSITHLTHKLLAERARQQQEQKPTEAAPPPYSATDDDSDDEADEDEQSLPMKLTINAAHNIQGCNNLVPTSVSPLADATKFSTILLQAISQINGAQGATNLASKPRRALKVDLTINCGITIVGDRNVIGNVGLRAKSPAETIAPCAAAAVTGAKRKAEGEPSEEPNAKKPAVVEE
ncbi:hypothetical protein BST61_g4710 [Cercospora zeina]